MNTEQKRQLSKIRKFIGSNDFGNVEQGLALLNALDDPELWEVFAEGLSVDGEGRLSMPKGSIFRRRVREPHRHHVALWVLNRTGRLQEVTTLDLNECRSLQNIDVLKGCTNLTTLNLKWGTFTVLQSRGALDVLKSLPNLTTLDLWGCSSLENVDELEGCTNLTTLNLKWCDSLKNVDGLQGLTNLTTLNLSGCESLQNVDGLKGCTNLTTLDLWGCSSLQNVDGLEGCTNLTTLKLHDCRSLRNIDVLEGCTNLTSLDLNGCYSLSPHRYYLTHYSGAATIRALFSRP